MLQDGCRVAVKVLDEYTHNRDALFMIEVQNLAKISHPNLVVIYGCTSLHSRKLMHVYQYVGNGIVYDHLHSNEVKYVRLTWGSRMNIIGETASALKYLHASNIVHRNIKLSNILLTADLHVKLGDFGLASPFPMDQSRVETGPQGTFDYVDPEYRKQFELTNKSDGFRFGVVMIEHQTY
jgi:serine/threonine protein kinase